MKTRKEIKIAFVGSVGIPNKYGGFEAFLEHSAPEIAKSVDQVIVTCDSSFYENKDIKYLGVSRIFIPVKANGVLSVIHDALAFFMIFRRSTHIFFMGVSGGLWFPFFRLISDFFGKKIIVNVDGVEWRRSKFGLFKKTSLRFFDFFAQCFSHKIIYDNKGLKNFVYDSFLKKSYLIAYPGDYVLRRDDVSIEKYTALTICRVEPENNLEILIDGFLKSNFNKYTIVGNWNNSDYGIFLRKKYMSEKRLTLLDPIYDAEQISILRSSCDIYLHGHSVGGTNPSLVEMLFYDCRILCFDVNFNRYTTNNEEEYFKNSDDLSDKIMNSNLSINKRLNIREEYSVKRIAENYIKITTD